MHMGKGTPLSDRPLQMGQQDDENPPPPLGVPVYAPDKAEPLTEEELMRFAQGLQEGRS